MNNTSSVLELVNKIPASLYFSQLPDRQQALKYLDYLYTNIPASRQVDSDKLFREVIARELRGVSMKIIEPEILLLVALDKITLADFQAPSGDLVRKVIAENTDNFDLDIMQRVMAQIMTKLPRDLRERVAGKHKLQVFQLVARQLNMDPKLLEKFANYDASLNHTISMELDAGDYNALNKKYLQELYNYQKTQPYISANSLEYGSLAAEMALSQASTPQTTTPALVKAQYIDDSPSLMVGAQDKTLYYFDPSSGTLSEMPINKNQTPVSVQDLKTILASQKINQADIQDAINDLNPATTIPTTTPTSTPNTTIPAGFFSQLENAFSGLITGTTQAQATIQATAKLAPTEPVPPAFLTKLYNLKHGEDVQTGGNQSDNYMRMNTGLRGSNISSSSGGYQKPGNLSTSQVASLLSGMYDNQLRPDFRTSATSNSSGGLSSGLGERGYTQNEALPIFDVTNPQTTYAGFGGLAPHQTNSSTTAPSTTARATFPGGKVMTTDEINMENKYQLLNQSYEQNTTTTTNMTTTTSPTTTAKSGFADIGANSQIITPEKTVAAKIKNDTKNVEKIAIGFITILILIFLIAVITYVKNAKSSS
jgi:hypothetical protein